MYGIGIIAIQIFQKLGKYAIQIILRKSESSRDPSSAYMDVLIFLSPNCRARNYEKFQLICRISA